MFYRQKILLALLETQGGSLSSTDLEKLLFLFCQTTQQNHYDFFPYKYGPFSFTSYEDRRKLVEQGLLDEGEGFKLITGSYIEKLHRSDRIALRRFAHNTINLRGQSLLQKVYCEYPRYAAKSEIVRTVFTPNQYNEAKQLWKNSTEQALFTIGYEGSSIDDYLYRLITNNIVTLVDVRKNPVSRKHGFSQKKLRDYLDKINVKYYHLPELGISSHLRKNLDDDQKRKDLFNSYADDIQVNQKAALHKINDMLNRYHRIALTCFEADHHMCHRHKIVDVLQAEQTFNTPIHHI